MDGCNQNIRTLVSQCKHELEDRNYSLIRRNLLSDHWEEFARWMQAQNYEELTWEIGQTYCIEKLGSDILPGVKKQDRLPSRRKDAHVIPARRRV